MPHVSHTHTLSRLPRCLMIAVCAATLAACGSAQSPTTPHPAHWAQVIHPEANFYQVDKLLYRSEQLIADDKPLIKQADIRTIVNLRYFSRNDDAALFADDDVQLINTPLLTWSISPKDLAHVLHTIRQAQSKGAVLVHCYHGADRTGIVVAMYRIIYQGRSIADAKAEMQQGNFGYHSIWKNIERLLSESNVQKVRDELAKLQAKQG
ncbi:tyrosine-protein phosphatase [Bergeriella denitrificans]|uniref:Protein tyrosine/serine phosphatase n=1 Tax=Bergeriella denitrificans TaxID=494 RepID=A0A378UH60_BERDE|nr:tyrosine-protein phosphatase [Bergeriella denitrificans]STZ76645.1 Protein tyrosine/serine phosphatase [Bergeriella denitrificans]